MSEENTNVETTKIKTAEFGNTIEVANELDANGNPAGGFVVGVGLHIEWQNGPRGKNDKGELEPGTGAFVEDVLVAGRQRLEFFQTTKYACIENANAIQHINEALAAMSSRAHRRNELGILGANVPETQPEPAQPKVADTETAPAPAPEPAKPEPRVFAPPVQHVLQFFTYAHLPEHLQAISKPFANLANAIAERSSNAETTVALRKLLESKDAAIRAAIVATSKPTA